jgi:hypothetical protein
LQIATSTAPQTLAETEISGDILDDLYKKWAQKPMHVDWD